MENGFRGTGRKCYNSIIQEQKNTLEKSWTEKIITSSNPQFERLVLFWHNHFVVGFEGSYERSHAYAKHILNLRKNAKGNLRDFLKDILKDPGMISYLNNDENFIGNVNENLGREFLELFTLGEGNYKENDVKNLSKYLPKTTSSYAVTTPVVLAGEQIQIPSVSRRKSFDFTCSAS